MDNPKTCDQIAEAVLRHFGHDRAGRTNASERQARGIADAVMVVFTDLGHSDACVHTDQHDAVTREWEDSKAELARLRIDLAEAADALRDVGKAAITVAPRLRKPYSDAPETSPWTQFMEQPARRAYNLGHRIRRQLNAAALDQPTGGASDGH